jgi:uncharacterized membrane protein
MTLQTSKILGGIGAILLLIGVFPYISSYGIVELIGLILVLAGLYGFANEFRERGIFTYAVYGVIIAIIGAIIAIAVAALIVLPNISDFIMKIYPAWDGNLESLPSLSNMTPNTSAIDFADIIPFISAGIAILLIGWITAIVLTFFFRRSLRLMTTKTSVGLFATSGLLLFIGAILLVLFFLGAIIMWIGVLLLVVAFFTTHAPEPTTTATPHLPRPQQFNKPLPLSYPPLFLNHFARFAPPLMSKVTKRKSHFFYVQQK